MKRIQAFCLTLICVLLLSSCAQTTETEWTLLKEKAITLKDGQYVSLWQNNFSIGQDIYKLPDDIILLTVEPLTGPENVSVVGVEGLDALNEAAQKNIKAYYQKQGLLYSLHEEL